MAILSSITVTRPNQLNGAGDELALAIAEFTGEVEGTIQRKSVTEGWVPVKSVKGTSTIQNKSIGESTLQVLTPGETPQASQNDIGRVNLTVDTTVLARAAVPLLDDFQTEFSARAEIGQEHGKKIAKFKDQAFFIQAYKAALLGASPYGSDGHLGGSVATFAAAGDATDPAKIYAKLAELFATMEGKDVDPQMDDLVIALRPATFYALLQAEQVINGDYVTAAGTKIDGFIFKAFGVPVVRSNNLPNTAITGHFLSNARNANAYDGDFTKAVASVFSPRALLAGATIDLSTKVFFDDLSKTWFIDAWLAFGVTPNRPEYSGALYLP